MSTAPLVEPRIEDQINDDVDHIYHCDPNIALCGRDISNDGYCPIGEDCTIHPECPLCEVAYWSDDWRCSACGGDFTE